MNQETLVRIVDKVGEKLTGDHWKDATTRRTLCALSCTTRRLLGPSRRHIFRRLDLSDSRELSSWEYERELRDFSNFLQQPTGPAQYVRELRLAFNGIQEEDDSSSEEDDSDDDGYYAFGNKRPKRVQEKTMMWKNYELIYATHLTLFFKALPSILDCFTSLKKLDLKSTFDEAILSLFPGVAVDAIYRCAKTNPLEHVAISGMTATYSLLIQLPATLKNLELMWVQQDDIDSKEYDEAVAAPEKIKLWPDAMLGRRLMEDLAEDPGALFTRITTFDFKVMDIVHLGHFHDILSNHLSTIKDLTIRFDQSFVMDVPNFESAISAVALPALKRLFIQFPNNGIRLDGTKMDSYTACPPHFAKIVEQYLGIAALDNLQELEISVDWSFEYQGYVHNPPSTLLDRAHSGWAGVNSRLSNKVVFPNLSSVKLTFSPKVTLYWPRQERPKSKDIQAQVLREAKTTFMETSRRLGDKLEIDSKSYC